MNDDVSIKHAYTCIIYIGKLNHDMFTLIELIIITYYLLLYNFSIYTVPK